MFGKDVYNQHIKVFTDSSVAISCIKKMGSCKPHLNDIARDIVHLELEWKLNSSVFQSLEKRFGIFDVD